MCWIWLFCLTSSLLHEQAWYRWPLVTLGDTTLWRSSYTLLHAWLQLAAAHFTLWWAVKTLRPAGCSRMQVCTYKNTSTCKRLLDKLDVLILNYSHIHPCTHTNTYTQTDTYIHTQHTTQHTHTHTHTLTYTHTHALCTCSCFTYTNSFVLPLLPSLCHPSWDTDGVSYLSVLTIA
jgi:hypothetical protein